MLFRTVKCGICGEVFTDKTGDGFPGWGQLSGAVLDNDSNPYLCPEHKAKMFDHADYLKRAEYNEGDVDDME
jgi:hypothetical protein